MMKRLVLMLSILVLLPISIFAISLADLQGNPLQYVKISEAKGHALYVDVNSINSLRYAPPYYTMQAKTYTVLYSEPMAIIKIDFTINYDYNRSIYALHSQIPPYLHNSEEIKYFLAAELEKDCGIGISLSNGTVYTLEGNYIKTLSNSELYKKSTSKIIFASSAYDCANFIFYHYYKQYFSLNTSKF